MHTDPQSDPIPQHPHTQMLVFKRFYKRNVLVLCMNLQLLCVCVYVCMCVNICMSALYIMSVNLNTWIMLHVVKYANTMDESTGLHLLSCEKWDQIKLTSSTDTNMCTREQEHINHDYN